MKRTFIYKTNIHDYELDEIYFNEVREMLEGGQCNAPVVICGVLGLWDGHHSIVPVKCDSMYRAILRCCGQDIDELEIDKVDGHFQVRAHHHDGTNLFHIHLLNEKGINTKNGDLNNRRYHKAIGKYWWR